MPCRRIGPLDLDDAVVEVDQHHAVGDDALAPDRDVLEGGDRALLARARSWRRSRPRPRGRGSSCRGRSRTSGRARTHGAAADLELHAGADEAQPVGLQPPAPAQLQPRPAGDQPRVAAVEHPVGAHEAQRARADRRAAAPERRGPAARRTCSSSVSIGADRILRRPMADRSPPSPSACSPATSARWRAASRWSRTTTPRAGRSSARSTRRPATRRSSASPGPPGAGKSTLIGALVKLQRALRPRGRGALDRPVARRSAAARCSATASG